LQLSGCSARKSELKPLGIDEPTLSRIVQGHRNPTPAQRARLKKALGRDYFRKPKAGKAA
jgi:plasmid maintenance system antidote protein VapI